MECDIPFQSGHVFTPLLRRSPTDRWSPVTPREVYAVRRLRNPELEDGRLA